MATSVPDTNTFSLQNVVAVVGGSDLITAYANSIDSYFDPVYKGSKNSLYNFRNYQIPAECHRPGGLTTTTIYYNVGSATLEDQARGLFYYVTGAPFSSMSSINGQMADHNVGTIVYAGTGTDCTVIADGYYVIERSSLNDLIYHIVGGVIVSKSSILIIGYHLGGGVLAYVLQYGDPGYDAYSPHGLIIPESDQSSGIFWHSTNALIYSAYLNGIGAGTANTNDIIAAYGTESNAARLCYDLSSGGYTDWILPSWQDLIAIHLNIDLLPNFAYNQYYWSSNAEIPYSGQGAVTVKMFPYDPGQALVKTSSARVRAARYF